MTYINIIYGDMLHHLFFSLVFSPLSIESLTSSVLGIVFWKRGDLSVVGFWQLFFLITRCFGNY